MTEAGQFVDNRPETHTAGYVLMNQIIPEEQGLSMNAFQVAGAVLMTKNMELKAAEAAQ